MIDISNYRIGDNFMTTLSKDTSTASDVVDFLDSLVTTGKAPNGAIRHLKTAFTKVLQTVQGSRWHTIDINNIDVDDYMSSFESLTQGVYTLESINTYRQRIKKVLDWYSTFLQDDSWIPPTRNNLKKKKSASTLLSDNQSPNRSQAASHKNEVHHPAENNVERLLNYGFPLENGQVISIQLPVPLTRSDADRISRFIDSIAIDRNSKDSVEVKM